MPERIVTEEWVEETAKGLVPSSWGAADYRRGEIADALRHLAPVVDALAAVIVAEDELDWWNADSLKRLQDVRSHLAAVLAERGLPSEWLGGEE